jgi:hypothetical protein
VETKCAVLLRKRHERVGRTRPDVRTPHQSHVKDIACGVSEAILWVDAVLLSAAIGWALVVAYVQSPNYVLLRQLFWVIAIGIGIFVLVWAVTATQSAWVRALFRPSEPRNWRILLGSALCPVRSPVMRCPAPSIERTIPAGHQKLPWPPNTMGFRYELTNYGE